MPACVTHVAFVHACTNEMTAETPSTDIEGTVTESHDPGPGSPFLPPVPVTSRRGTTLILHGVYPVG
jgi:hypothetical protein